MFVTCLGEPFFVTENDVFLGDMGVHARADGFRVRSRTRKLSRAVSVGFTYTKCSLAPKEILMLMVICQSLWKTVYTPLLDPGLAGEHGDHDGHEGGLDARVFAPYCTPVLIVVSQ